MICCLAFLGIFLTVPTNLAADEFWEYTPYRILLLLDVQRPPGASPRIESSLQDYILDRCAMTAGPIWKVTPADEPIDSAWFDNQPPDLTGDSFPSQWSMVDKVLFIRVVIGWHANHVVAREFDVATRQFGARIERLSQQPNHLHQLVFRALVDAFLPLAQFRIDRDDEEHVLLSFKAQELNPAADDFRLFEPSGLLVPIFRRNDREGRPREDGIQQVPWTYLVMEPAEEGSPLQAKIFSATKRPFGLRRRGRIEQYALTARLADSATELRLVSRIDPAHPIAGCRLFERKDPKAEPADATDQKTEYQLLGISDRDGRFRLEPTDFPIRTVWIKSGQLLLAKLPVVPGLQPVLEVPLPEDEARLEAEGKLTALRNNLIDLVTRRSILSVRIHSRLDAGDIDEAKRLFARFEELPRGATFKRELEQQEQIVQSDDPQTQRRIDGLFTRTKAVLGSFLDPRDVIRLQDAIHAASREPSQ